VFNDKLFRLQRPVFQIPVRVVCGRMGDILFTAHKPASARGATQAARARLQDLQENHIRIL